MKHSTKKHPRKSPARGKRHIHPPRTPREWVLAVALIAVIIYLFIGVVVSWNSYVRRHINATALRWYPLPAATVGTTIVPLSRYERDVTAITRYIGESHTEDQYAQVSVEDQVLQRLIRAALIERIAHRYNIAITNDQVEAAYEAAAAEEPGSVEQVLEQYYGFTPAEFKVWIAEYLLEDAVRTQVPKMRTIDHILIAVDSAASDTDVTAAQTKAQGIIDQINGGADFTTLATQESNDLATRDNGGALGSLTRGTAGTPIIDQAFEDAAFAAPLNTVTGPVRTTKGWDIIRVTAETGQVDLSFDDLLTQERRSTSIVKFVQTR